MSNLAIKILAVGLAVFATLAAKAGGTKAGAEFTFTNPAILAAVDGPWTVETPVSERYKMQMMRAALSTCDGCRVVYETNSLGYDVYKILYPDGFYFVISPDPGCIEVQMAPLTNEGIRKNMQRMKRDLFGAAAKVGMKPSPNVGGGHIHFGWLSATDGDLLTTRNILVDFINHPELAQGIFGMSVRNAPPLAAQPKQYQDAFKQIVADVDSGKVKSVHALMKRVRKEAYAHNAYDYDPYDKYQAWNISRIGRRQKFSDEEATFEGRFFLAQNSPEEFEMQTRLIDGRIDYIRKFTTPIPVDIPNVTKMSLKAKYDRFSKFCAQAGIDFAEVREKTSLYRPRIAKTTRVYPIVRVCRDIFAEPTAAPQLPAK